MRKLFGTSVLAIAAVVISAGMFIGCDKKEPTPSGGNDGGTQTGGQQSGTAGKQLRKIGINTHLTSNAVNDAAELSELRAAQFLANVVQFFFACLDAHLQLIQGRFKGFAERGLLLCLCQLVILNPEVGEGFGEFRYAAAGGLIDGFHPNKYIPEHFDLVISGCHLLMYDFINRPRIEKLAPHFIPILEKGLDVQACFKPFAQYTPYLDGQLAEIAVAHGGSRITNLGWFTGLDIHQNDPVPLALDNQITQDTLRKLGLTDQTYITIHDGINPHTDPSRSDRTRNWPKTYWKELCALIKHQCPAVQIVQLGGSTSSPFEFVDISLVGKTSIADLPHILKNAHLHIDGETGMVHLSNLTQTPCVVLFGPSKAVYLGYSRNTNIQSQFCAGCMNISKHWMTQCLLGYPPEKQCLAAITPQMVFEAVKNHLQL